MTTSVSPFDSNSYIERWGAFSQSLFRGLTQPVPDDYVAVSPATTRAAVELCELLARRRWPGLVSLEIRREPEGEIGFRLEGSNATYEFDLIEEARAYDLAIEDHQSGHIQGETVTETDSLLQRLSALAA